MFQFTDDEWDRPDGLVEIICGESRIWNKACMAWRTPTRMICPDHERMLLDPEAAPVLALIHRKLSGLGKHLKLIK